jgi:hypothetical protein
MSAASCSVAGCDRTLIYARTWCEMHYRRWLEHGDPTVTLNRRMDGATLADKLEAYADRSGGPDSCWPWTRGRSTDGYGRVYPPKGRQAVPAHRVAFELAGGTVEPGEEILHSCDNPPCVNPAHLRRGSHAENMAEMAGRGRSAAGSRNPRTKLSSDQVEEVRQMARSGLLQRDIAARFGVSRPFVSRLIRGERR